MIGVAARGIDHGVGEVRPERPEHLPRRLTRDGRGRPRVPHARVAPQVIVQLSAGGQDRVSIGRVPDAQQVVDVLA